MKTLVKLLILFILLAGTLNGQSNQWPEWENHVNTQKVNDILIDGDYLWLATRGGLIRFSKTTGEKIIFNKGNSNIPDNAVNNIAQDSNGNLWLACHYYGIGMYNGHDFIRFNDTNSSIPSIQWNLAICIDSKGNKWFGSLNNVVKFDGETWETWATGSPISSSNIIHDIYVDKNDDVWVAGEWGAGIVKNGEFNYFTEVTKDISCITGDNDGNIWLGGKNNTLIKYANHQFEYITLAKTSSDDEIRYIEADGNNTLWISSSAGLIRYSQTEETVYDSTNCDLPLDGIMTIVADGVTIWIATLNNGLYKFAGDVFSKVAQLGVNEIPNIRVINDIELFENSIYFAGMQNRVVKKNENNVWSSIDTVQGIVDVSNYTIRGNGSNLLIGSCCKSSLSYIENDSIYPISNFKNFGAVYDILPIDNNSYWLGTSEGLVRYNNGVISLYDISNSPLISNAIKDVELDNEGNLWGALHKGIFKFSNDNWTIYDTHTTNLLNYDITKIKIDSENKVWFNALDTENRIGLYDGNGITCFDGYTWQNYNTYNSELPSNTVFDILIDEEDNIWCGTFVGGLSKFDKNKVWKVYNAYNSGIAHNDVSSLEKLSDGKLWIGHWRGEVSVLDLNNPSSDIIFEGKTGNLKIFPNPAQEYVCIKIPEGSVNPKELRIYDLSGKLMGIKKITWEPDSQINFFLSDFSIKQSGVYFIELITENGLYRNKIIIVRFS